MKERVKWIDIAYGLMMVLIVVGHTLGPYKNSFLGSFIYTVHMPILFILMGYMFQRHSYKFQFTDSFVRYLVPYFFTAILVIGLNSLALVLPKNIIIHSQSKSILSSVISVLYGAGSIPFNPWGWQINPIGLIWILLAMFLATQLFNLMMTLLDKYQQPEFVRVIVVIVLAIVGGWLGKTVYLPWTIGAVLFVQLLMYIGYVVKKTGMLEHLPNESYILFAGVWSVSGFFGYFTLNIPSSPNLLISLLGAFGGSICIFRISQYLATQKSNIGLRILDHLGQGYLIVICFHLISLDIFKFDDVLFKTIESFTGSFIAVIITILYRLLFVTIFVLLVPKIPGLRNMFIAPSVPSESE